MLLRSGFRALRWGGKKFSEATRLFRREARFKVARIESSILGKATLESDLTRFGKKVFSQNDEDGILEYLFFCLGPGGRFFVEIGVGPPWTGNGFAPVEKTGLECNSRCLAERQGWRGVLLDGGTLPEALGVKREFITAENINALLTKYHVPRDFDLFSLDVDGNDYWIWRALEYRPRVVVIEYNAGLGANESKTITYDPGFSWASRGHTNYYGASLLALTKLGKEKGYVLVYANGVNAIFVQRELVPGRTEFDYRRRYRQTPRPGAIAADEAWVHIE